MNTTSTADPIFYYNYLNNFVLNPVVIIIILLIIVAFYVFSSSLGNDSSNMGNMQGSQMNSIFGIIIVVVLVILIIINAFQYFFSINITAYIKNLFHPKTELDIVVDQNTIQPAPVPEIKFRRGVCNPCSKTCDFSIIESKINTEQNLRKL